MKWMFYAIVLASIAPAAYWLWRGVVNYRNDVRVGELADEAAIKATRKHIAEQREMRTTDGDD